MNMTNQEKQAGVPHRIRLKIRTGKALSTEEEMLKFSVAGRDVTLRSARNQQPLSEASWLLMDSQGFVTEDEAREFGEHLRRTADLVGVCTRIGLDGRGPSDDRQTSRFNEEWLRSEGVVKEGQRVGPDIHGLVVIPDDREIVWLSAGPVSGRVTSDPNRFIRAMEETALGAESLSIQQAIRVLNLAQINGDPLAKVVLSISAIEALAETDQEWSDEQRNFKAALSTWLESQYGDQEGTKEISDAIERLHRRSIRQQLKKTSTTERAGGRTLAGSRQALRPAQSAIPRRRRLGRAGTLRARNPFDDAVQPYRPFDNRTARGCPSFGSRRSLSNRLTV